MVAGSAAWPELGRRVMREMEPWVTLAEEAVGRVELFDAGPGTGA
jgi:hypothetical protein